MDAKGGGSIMSNSSFAAHLPMPSFLEIYGTHQKMVFNLCLNYLQNRQDAEEAAQDVFVKIHAKLGGFEAKSSLQTWIYRIAINHCFDVLRAKKRQKRFAFFTEIFSKEAEKLADFNHPGVQLEDREALENLFQKINQLPENQRTALILRHLDDLPQREIADILGISEKVGPKKNHRKFTVTFPNYLTHMINSKEV